MLGAKKPVFCTEQFFSHRRRIVSGFGLGVAASIIVLSLFLLNQSLKAPKFQTFLQGFHSSAANSSFASRAFSFSTANSSSSKIGSNGIVGLHKIEDGGVLNRTGSRNDTTLDVHGNTPVRNSIPKDVNESFQVVEGRVQQKPLVDKGNVLKHASEINGNSVPLRLRTEIAHAEKFVGREPWKNSTFSYSMNGTAKNISTHQFLNNATSSGSSVGSESSDERAREVLIRDKDETISDSQQNERKDGSYENCDIFDGKWVRDDSKPYYPAGSCPYIDKDFDCHLNGRPDSQYVKWKWQPNGCDIPSLNATDFLERLKGKRLVFVGDSLNRNMWESLVCILRQSIRHKKHVYEISGRSEFKKKGFYAFRFEDYNTSIDFVGAPFLVRESVFKGMNGSMDTLRLDMMDGTTKMYHDADIIVFNTGHWWTHEKTSRGEDYYQEGNYVHPRLKVLEAYKRALTTWAKWVDRHIDHNRTQVFFRGYSVTHFSGGQWNSGGQCHKETEPIYNVTYLEKYPSKMRALEYVVKKMKTPVTYLNISRLTDYRKDGHPSIYRMQYKTEAESKAAERYQDCSHWCLPGVPDTWNELLYVSLLKSGHESRKN